ncbi:MAG TPA: hypothetical protein VMF55_06270 [Solirubrobacterales bacterium]|nr:hypothetical protein [Solirubrobacterales bacterium]
MRLPRRRTRPAVIPGAEIGRPTDETTLDEATGAVKSRQAADIVLPAEAIAGIWTPEHLERVARTYWATLRRFTLGLVRVDYTPTERAVVLLVPQLRLLTFRAPEYEMDRCRGIVRWRIEKGLLVSARGRGGDGYLEIEIRRHDGPAGKVTLNVGVEVANYYPTLGGLSRWIYANTQSRIHVIACNFFLRRLVRRDLATSRVGHFAGPASPDQAPDPT